MVTESIGLDIESTSTDIPDDHLRGQKITVGATTIYLTKVTAGSVPEPSKATQCAIYSMGADLIGSTGVTDTVIFDFSSSPVELLASTSYYIVIYGTPTWYLAYNYNVAGHPYPFIGTYLNWVEGAVRLYPDGSFYVIYNTSAYGIKSIDVSPPIYTKTISSDAHIFATVSKTIVSDAKILVTGEDSINSTAYIKRSYSQSISSDAYIFATVSKTINSSAQLTRVAIVNLVYPADGGKDTSPVVFRWQIPSDLDNRNMNCELYVDGTTYKTWVDSGFEYYNGAAWVSYPTDGVGSAYYGNEARRSTIVIGIGDKTWKARGAVETS